MVGRARGLAERSGARTGWDRVEAEPLEHFRALIHLDTRNPPGKESRTTRYLRYVLARAGITAEFAATDPGTRVGWRYARPMRCGILLSSVVAAMASRQISRARKRDTGALARIAALQRQA